MPLLPRSFLLTSAACLAVTAAQATPPDDTIVVGLSADASTFETAEIRSADNINIANYLFTTLTQIGDDGTILPRLATGWTISEDGKTVTFALKPGQTCEDGEALTAEDVAWSWNRAADPANKFAGNTPGFVYTSMGFDRAEAVDDATVAIHVKARNPMAVGFTSQVMIHCKDSLEKMTPEDIASKPLSSGEYRLVNWTRNGELVLEKRQDPGTFQNIIFRVIPEASTRTAELLAGNVDIITNVSPDQVDTINASGLATVQAVQGLRRMYIGFNQKPTFTGVDGDAFKKPEVRRALQYAVDVPGICKQLLNFECRRMTGMVNPPNDHPDLEPYPYDPAMAEKLLDEAGYPRGADGVRFKTKLQTPRGRYLNDVNVAQAVGAFLTEVGVETEVEVLDWASVYTPLIRAHDAGPLFLLGSGGVLWSAVYDMAILARVTSGPNYTEWSDPRWFDRWDEMMNEQDPAKQRQIINEMLEVFYEDGPWLHMYYQPDFYGVGKRVDWTARRDETIDLWDVQLAK
ncbi:MAG TPA: ABC transporter substrate-binding protein [Paracoccaceae bacterium]|nr:ABC transporter substrate-binding protein [Paracoccaceae bacterium]